MDERTIKTYNEQAREYDEYTADFWELFPTDFIDQFRKQVPAGGNVLDVGSGPGRDGLILEKAGLDVTCLDASEAMVSLTREKGLVSVLGDFSDMPFGAGSFDAVWAYTSLLHISKREISQALAEVRRVLTSGGILGLGLIEGDTEGYRESTGEVEAPRYFAYYQKEEVERLLETAGFKPFFFDTFKPKTHNYLHFLARVL